MEAWGSGRAWQSILTGHYVRGGSQTWQRGVQPRYKCDPRTTPIPFSGGRATQGSRCLPPGALSRIAPRRACEGFDRKALALYMDQAKSELHLDNVPLGQLPPGGDPHVITIQLHHGCVGRRRMQVGGLMVSIWTWQDSALVLYSQASPEQRLSDQTPT